MNTPRNRRTGFTLIELLVVVAVIALLVSILLPSLARARELARRSVCGTNLKGLSNAVALYTSENTFYPGLFGNPDEWDLWFGRLEPYIQRVETGFGWEGETAHNMGRCPSAKMNRKFWDWTMPHVSYIGSTKIFKGPNYWDPVSIWPTRDYANPDHIDMASRQLMLGESWAGAHPWWNDYRVYHWEDNDYIWGDGIDSPVIKYLHGDADETNILFADHHVEMGIGFMQGRREHYQDPTNDSLEDPPGWTP